MVLYKSVHSLFGGKRGWRQDDWTSSDDRVRGGKSQSFLQLDKGTATFHGNLDIKTLGGAGFASQRTTGDDQHWNLEGYDGILLKINAAKSDSKSYTFILKDEILPKHPHSGREQSTLSWEYEFQIKHGRRNAASQQQTEIRIPWQAFKATYRGKEKQPEKPLAISDIRRISIMMRSYFGSQEGCFQLCIAEIAAYKMAEDDQKNSHEASIRRLSDSSDSTSKQTLLSDPIEPRSMWSRLLSLCCRL